MSCFGMFQKLVKNINVVLFNGFVSKKKQISTFSYCSSVIPDLLCRLVTVTPGFTEFTRTPLPANSKCEKIYYSYFYIIIVYLLFVRPQVE